jgi:hypothetical protein
MRKVFCKIGLHSWFYFNVKSHVFGITYDKMCRYCYKEKLNNIEAP